MKQNKSINEPGTVLESQVSGVPIVSNHMGPNGESIDRIYGGGAIPIRLVNKDYTTYKGNISKVSIMKKVWLTIHALEVIVIKQMMEDGLIELVFQSVNLTK